MTKSNLRLSVNAGCDVSVHADRGWGLLPTNLWVACHIRRGRQGGSVDLLVALIMRVDGPILDTCADFSEDYRGVAGKVTSCIRSPVPGELEDTRADPAPQYS